MKNSNDIMVDFTEVIEIYRKQKKELCRNYSEYRSKYGYKQTANNEEYYRLGMLQGQIELLQELQLHKLAIVIVNKLEKN